MANAKTYLQNAYNAQNKAADEALKKYQAQVDLSKKNALQTFEGAKTNALQDYYRYINPYGVQAEALGRKGLSNSGLSQTNLSRGWSNYQNVLGQANSAYQNALAQADVNMLGYQADINAQKQQNMANYQQNLYEYALAHSYGGGSSASSSSGITGNSGGVSLNNMLNTALSVRNALSSVEANAKKQNSKKRNVTNQAHNYDTSTVRGNEYTWW